VSLLWLTTPQRPSAEAGMHRWVWDLRGSDAGRGRGTGAPAGGRGGQRGGGGGGRFGGPPLTGTFTVKLTVEGKTYTRPLIVKPDPRFR
jgi:hypothetical protein